jgi:predicted aspartyl protease
VGYCFVSRFALASSFSAALALLGMFAAAQTQPVPSVASRSQQEVRFKLYKGFAVVVRGSIGEVRNLNFLIDTGSSPTVIDRRVARKLRLNLTSAPLSTFTQRVTVEEATATDIRLGPAHADQLRVLVHDLSVLEETLGVRIDAMLGYDFLGQSPFTIDYRLQSIVFGPIDPLLDTVPYAGNLPYVVIRMRVHDEDVPLLVDTGAHDLIVFEDGLRSIASQVLDGPAHTWTNLGGNVQVKPLDFSGSFLGSVPWADRDAFLLQGARSSSSGFKGLLGVAALQSGRIAFDPVQHVFAWESKEPRFASAVAPQ